MSTAAFDVACSIPIRIQELDRLTKLASEHESSNEQTYNTLCRACCVLMASHLDGFLKDLGKSLATDLNFYLKSFGSMPEAMKRSFCEKIAFYEGVPADEINHRVAQLHSFFSTNSVAIDLNAFSYKENKNRNSGPDVIEATLSKMGVPAVLRSMTNVKIEDIFKDDTAQAYAIRRDMRRYRSFLYSFPYRRLPARYAFNYAAAKAAKGKSGSSLWHDFIEEVMRRRHSIAHGDTMTNDTNVKQLNQDIEKVDVLMHGVLYSATTYLTK
ncbi:HEPN domain-containing protein [Paraburkholderia ginsengiterrae]|uniref:HEPN domain-containing protein n=1 Tax=Paraburkholderia ginsengiterrae TaxID=1462993 RepID=UPI000A80D4F4|nr:HEPN domain-containing protein [Paraburkholderia ginsengiterrae]